MIKILCLLSFLMPLSLYAQNVMGSVKDENSLPIENAVISITSVTSKESQFTTSTSEGNFHFSNLAPDAYTLWIKALGYQVLHDTLTVAATMRLPNFVLEKDIKTLELQEVTIKSERPTIEHSVNGVVVNVSQSYLKNLPVMQDVLTQIPEISTEGGSILVLGKSNIGYYINGKQSAINLTNIPVASIEKIEIITNPSGKYDAAMEAVINVILKKKTEEGYNGEATVQYEQRAKPRYNLSGLFSYNAGIFNSSLTLAHGFSTTYNTQTNFEQNFYRSKNPYVRKVEELENSRSHYEEMEAAFSLNFSKTKILSFQASYQPNYVPGTTFKQSNDFISNNKPAPDSSSSSHVDWKYYTRYANAGLKYEWLINKVSLDYRFDFLWQDDLTNTANDFNFKNFKKTENDVSIETHQFRESLAYVPSFNGRYAGEHSTVEFGAKYYYINSLLTLDFSKINQYTPANDFDYRAHENVLAVYGNFSSTFKKFTYDAGVRGEFSRLYGNYNIQAANQIVDVVLPSASITYAINQEQKIMLAYNKKVIRVPFSRLSPLYYLTSPFDAYEGNPYLRPQIAHSAQLKYTVGSKSITFFYTNYAGIMGALPHTRDNITILQFLNYNQSQLGAIIGLPIKQTKWLNGQCNLRMYAQTNAGESHGVSFTNKIITSSISATETISLPKEYTANILLNYFFPRYSHVNKIVTYPSLDFSLVKKFSATFTMSCYLRDIFSLYNLHTVSRDFDGITYSSTTDTNTRGVSISLTYAFLQGRKTATNILTNDDVKDRL